MLEGLTVSNGLEWSPDGTLAYHNDTATHTIAVYAYDRETGLTDRRVFAALEHRPDGLTVDAEGGVWTALSDGGAVRRYTPDGELDAVIEVPARKVTACTFGGAALDELFITTSREGLEPGDDPRAGRAVPRRARRARPARPRVRGLRGAGDREPRALRRLGRPRRALPAPRARDAARVGPAAGGFRDRRHRA